MLYLFQEIPILEVAIVVDSLTSHQPARTRNRRVEIKKVIHSVAWKLGYIQFTCIHSSGIPVKEDLLVSEKKKKKTPV